MAGGEILSLPAFFVARAQLYLSRIGQVKRFEVHISA
jgi:hypothetical protein